MIGKLLIWPIRLWQVTLSRILPPSCRFAPSCSAYAIEAIERHGPMFCGSSCAQTTSRRDG